MIKKRYLVILALIIVGGGVFMTYNSSSDVSDNNWEKKYPQLANNVGYSKLAESVPAYQAKTASEQELIGKVTNQFGIRDDVLKLILTSIPESDTRSTIAAIKMAQYFQQQIGVTDDKEMNVIANRASAAMSCINLPMLEMNNLINNYAEMLRDTSARQTEQHRIEGLLANHVISADYGIQSYDLKEQCNHFLGESK